MCSGGILFLSQSCLPLPQQTPPMPPPYFSLVIWSGVSVSKWLLRIRYWNNVWQNKHLKNLLRLFLCCTCSCTRVRMNGEVWEEEGHPVALSTLVRTSSLGFPFTWICNSLCLLGSHIALRDSTGSTQKWKNLDEINSSLLFEVILM